MEISKKVQHHMCCLKNFLIFTYLLTAGVQSHSCARTRALLRAHTSVRAHDTSVKLKFLPLFKTVKRNSPSPINTQKQTNKVLNTI